MRRKLKNCFWLCSGEMARPQCAGRGISVRGDRRAFARQGAVSML